MTDQSTLSDVIQPPSAPEKEKRDYGSVIQQLLAFLSLILLMVFFSFASENFLTISNVSSMLLGASVIGILALSATIIILTGGIDLSVGTGMAFTSVITALVAVNLQMPLWLGIIAGILAGGILGFINGFNIAVLDLPPFIATLAMMMIAESGALVLSGIKPIYFNDYPIFNKLSIDTPFLLPNGVYVFIILTIVAWVLLSFTLFGRYTFAMGSNLEAARLSGINTKKWLIAVYTVAGLFTGAGGVMMAARLNSAQPSLGMGYELQAIAAVIIGGTSLSGGRGSVVGTIIGALIMSVLTTGLRIIKVSAEWQDLVIGLVILVAVFLDRLRSDD